MAETTPRPGPDEGWVEMPASLSIDWGATLAEHDSWLRTAVLARLGERQAVDEVMQEVALAAVAQRAPLKDPARVGAWLYRLALRIVLLYRRKCGRQRRLLGSYAAKRGDGQTRSCEADPLHWLLREERQGMVRDALVGLPRRDAEVLLLKYTENWSYRELASHMGLSESAVEARLHRARQRLRDAILVKNEMEVPE